MTVALSTADTLAIGIFMLIWKATDHWPPSSSVARTLTGRHFSVLLETDLTALIASGGARKPNPLRMIWSRWSERLERAPYRAYSYGMSTMLRKAEPRLRWVIASLLLIAVNVLLLGYRVGVCTDYTTESGAESTCTNSPLLGTPGTWAFGILSLFTIAYFAYRIIRRPVPR